MGCFKSKSYQPFIKNSTEPDFFLVDIPEISDITESPVEIFVTANVSDPPAQPPLLDCPENTETPESDIDLSHGNGQMIPYQEQGGNEPVIPTSEWRIQGTETPPDRYGFETCSFCLKQGYNHRLDKYPGIILHCRRADSLVVTQDTLY
ncbi:hypothetical protein XENTR_v10023847 [Xenopus tropicalis]|nr:hypothetical protein XENTR_v10023847 [Xenopus tropicalis]